MCPFTDTHQYKTCIVGDTEQAPSRFLASEQLSVMLQVINIRTLKPLDRDTIVDSVRKTHRMVAVEEGWPQSGVTAELIATINEECFDDLDAPPERVTGLSLAPDISVFL